MLVVANVANVWYCVFVTTVSVKWTFVQVHESAWCVYCTHASNFICDFMYVCMYVCMGVCVCVHACVATLRFICVAPMYTLQ